MIRTLSIAAGAAGLAWFILPVFTGRILNIGNVTGLALSLCLLICGLKQKQILVLLHSLWQGSLPARILLTAAGAAAAAVFVTALVLTCMMIRAAVRRPDPDAPVIVLGCQVRGDRPSLMLTGRMDAAAAYLQEHPAAVCVLSGGKGEGEEITEAACMFRYMTARGISPERLLLEERSTSTRENLQFSAKILREAGLIGADLPDGGTDGGKGGSGTADVAVVTNEFHACRAALIAGSLGLRAGAVNARSPWWLFPTFYVRELYGLLYQLFL